MRLIDADSLDFCFPMPDDFNGMMKQIGIKMAEARVMNAPTVDAVEVVRCRKCKYSYGNKYCTNDAWKDEGNTVYIDPDGFCSYGERRADSL